MDIDYCAMGVADTPPDQLSPGELAVSPLTSSIPALEHQALTLHYLPGEPNRFQEKLEIQVAHFEPDVILITGAAVFPRINFSLPRLMDGVSSDVQMQAKVNLGMSVGESQDVGVSVPASEAEQSLSRVTAKFQTEVERLLVKEFANKNADRLFGAAKRGAKLRYEHP